MRAYPAAEAAKGSFGSWDRSCGRFYGEPAEVNKAALIGAVEKVEA